MVDPAYDVGSNGPLSMANSPGLVTVDVRQAALAAFEARPVEPAVSVNAWTGLYEQFEKGRIVGNVII